MNQKKENIYMRLNGEEITIEEFEEAKKKLKEKNITLTEVKDGVFVTSKYLSQGCMIKKG